MTFPVIVLITAFSQFVGAGGAPLAAIEMGRGNDRRASKMMGNGCLLLCVMSVVLTVFFLFASEPILMLFGASEQTIGYAMEYLGIYLWGTLFVELTQGLNPFIYCQGKARTAMASVLIGAVLNIALDPVFIFVLDMGVRGAAIATVISQAASAIWVVGFLASRRSRLRLTLPSMRPDGRILRAMAMLGVSPFIMRFTECMIQVVFNTGLQNYGGDLHVGAMTILQSLMQINTTVINGFTQGMQPVISYNFGAGNLSRVRQACRFGIVTCFFLSLLMSLSMMLFPSFYVGLFTDQPDLIAAAAAAAPVFMAGMTVFGIQMGCQNAFLGLSRAGVSLFLACLRKVILLISLALLLPLRFGVWGIYTAEPIADVLSALTAGVLFFRLYKTALGDKEKTI